MRYTLRVTLFIISIMLITSSASTQDAPRNLPDLYLIIFQDNTLSARVIYIDLDGGTRLPFRALNVASTATALDWGLVSDTQLLIVEGTGQDRRGLSTHTQVVLIDLVTGEHTPIVEHPGIYRVIPSPDGRSVSLIYFEAERAASSLRICLLPLDDPRCVPLELGQSVTYDDPGQWISNTEYVVRIGIKLHVATLSGDVQSYEFPPYRSFSTVAVAASTGQVFVLSSERNDPGTDVFELERGTGSWGLIFSIESESPFPIGIFDFTVSDDGAYAAYWTEDEGVVIRTIETGEVVSTDPDSKAVESLHWLHGTHRLVANVNVGEAASRLVLIEADSSAARVLAEGSKGYVLVPHRLNAP